VRGGRGVVRRVAYVVVLGVTAALVSLPAFGAEAPQRTSTPLLNHLSESVALHYFMAHPDQAPDTYRQAFRSRSAAASRTPAARPRPIDHRFNLDTSGLPQNEESVAVCPNNRNIVLEGANDFRALLDFNFDTTGWYLSSNGGKSVAKEGLVPPSTLGSGTPTPSGGDPVMVADAGCNLYAGSIDYNALDPMGGSPNGVVVYRTTPGTLLSPQCGDAVNRDGSRNMSDPDCWPTAVPVAQTVGGDGGHFFDKDWVAVGDTGDGEHVWVTYTDFTLSSTQLGFTNAQVYAVRCEADLSGCTAPILVSQNDNDVGFSYVTVGPDGRTYVTWAGVQGEYTQQPETFTIKMRIAPAGSTTFGPETTAATLDQAIGFGTLLHADDFRITTGPKNDVAMVNGHAREFIVYETCGTRVAGSICDYPRVVLAYSDNDGASWGFKRVSAGGDNYFPTLSVDRQGGKLAVSWYTNRFDPWGHRQDVQLAVLNPATLKVLKLQRVTSRSNEPDADSVTGGGFIGDYFQVEALGGQAYIGYNANYARMRLLGLGPVLHQQDNFLAVEPLR
jgi:hypothetical protein